MAVRLVESVTDGEQVKVAESEREAEEVGEIDTDTVGLAESDAESV